jgi:glycosyltransferase involved in cell wall biosynthesis
MVISLTKKLKTNAVNSRRTYSVAISCSTKFHAFALAEQLEKNGQLAALFTTYAYGKNILMRRLAGRVDKEKIPVEKIHTLVPLAVGMKTWNNPHFWNDWFDRWVAGKIAGIEGCTVFIGWSGMSLRALRSAKAAGKITIIERGSSHIRYQDKMLHEEYKRFGIDFHVDPRTVEKELAEYEEADYISIPSTFVKNSFLEFGVPASKLIQNAYGTSGYFKRVESNRPKDDVFRVLYLGSLTIRKGLIYLFEALQKLPLAQDKFEAWFIGKVDEEMKSTVEKYARPNWKFFGHVNHYELPAHISACDVAVHPSLEEGLSLVTLQMLGCGVPVISTTNTGGEDIIEEGESGFIVPIRDAGAIAEKIMLLFEDRERLAKMKTSASQATSRSFSWDDYGRRYTAFIGRLIA